MILGDHENHSEGSTNSRGEKDINKSETSYATPLPLNQSSIR